MENHPSLIKDTILRKKKVKPEGPKQIKLSAKTGMPVGVIEPSATKEVKPAATTVQQPVILQRSENESKEEKRQRKKLVKEQKRAKREIKKNLKQVFKDEEKRQGTIYAMPHTRQKVVVKY